MYDLNLAGMYDDNGDRLNFVYLLHAPCDSEKIVRLRENMQKNGWQGRPILMSPHIDGGDFRYALTGSHRLAAVAGLDDIDIPVVTLPDDMSAEEWDMINDAIDDDHRVNVLRDLCAENENFEPAFKLMQLEVNANNGN